MACALYSIQAIQGGMKKNPCHTGWAADLSLSWLHKSYCRFCHVLAHMFWRNRRNIRAQLFKSCELTELVSGQNVNCSSKYNI